MAEYKGAGDTVTINDVLEVCGKYITNQESIDLINQAYDFIMEKHEGQIFWQRYKRDPLLLRQDFCMMSWKIVEYLGKKW